MINKFNPRKMKGLRIIDKFLSVFFHCRKNTEELDFVKIREIIIVDFSAIGDIVQLTSFIKVLKTNMPFATISIVCEEWAKDILEDQNLIDHFYFFRGDLLLRNPFDWILNYSLIKKVIQSINVKNYDLAIEPKGDLRFIFFMNFIKGKKKVSYNYTGGKSFLTDSVMPSPNQEHYVEEKLYLLEAIGCKINSNDKYPKLELSKADIAYNELFLIENDLQNKFMIGIHPGSSAANKQWHYFGKLAKMLYQYYGKQIAFLIFEGPKEEEASYKIVKELLKVGATYILVKEKLKLYIKRLALCQLVICNDSGAGHIAAAYKIPVVSIFGATNPDNFKPYGNGIVSVISHDYPCKPCLSTSCLLGYPKCLQEIYVTEVLNEIKRLALIDLKVIQEI